MQHFRFIQFFLLMTDIAAFAGFAQAVTLDGMGQNHGGLSDGFHRRLVGVVDLARVVAAAAQLHDLVIAQMRYQVQQLGILSEEILADVGAIFADVGLELAVHHFAHALFQQAGGVAAQ